MDFNAIILYLSLIVCCSCVPGTISEEKQQQQSKENNKTNRITSCKLPRGREGICKDISECPAALSNLRAGLKVYEKCPGESRKIACCPTTLRPSKIACTKYTKILKESSKGLVPLLPPEFFEGDEETDEIKCTVSLNALISGGRPANLGEFPHVVALGYNVSNTPWRCGGTLISDQFVITAAHCVTNPIAGKPLKVLLGEVTLSRSSGDTRQIIDVEDVIVHPRYSTPLTYHDLALVKLAEKAKLSRSVLPTCLPQPENDFLKAVENRTLNVAGWGVLGTGEPQSDTLQVASLSGFSLKSCNKFYDEAPSKVLKFPAGIGRSQICAGDKNGNKDTCKGDSGGPLWITERCIFYLMGITSFGPNQCGEKVPGVYTNIYTYLDWIEDNVWPQPEHYTS